MEKKTTTLAQVWNYHDGVRQQDALIQQLTAIDAAWGKRLRASLRHGGKAFGLTIAERLATEANTIGKKIGLGVTFSVPLWQGYTREELEHECLQPPKKTQVETSWWDGVKLFFGQKPSQHASSVREWPLGPCIVRSSAHHEDWLSGEAGEYVTTQPDLSRYEQRRETLARHCRLESFSEEVVTSSVVQQYERGVGLVIDLVYSPLLKRVVARVAWGREATSYFSNKPEYSSATWDCQGPQGLFCPEYGEELIELRSPHPLSNDLPRNFSSALVRVLYRVLADWRWPGGVQLELVKHPGSPHFFIVQIRPSPSSLHLDPTVPLTVPPEAELQLQTVGVNRAYRYEGVGIKIDDDGFITTRGLLARAVNSAQVDVVGIENATVLWQEFHHSSCYQNCLAEMAREGVAAQVSACTANNTVHSFPSRNMEFSKRDAAILRDQVLFATNLSVLYGGNKERHKDFVRRVYAQNRRILLLSDGIVGAMYLL